MYNERKYKKRMTDKLNFFNTNRTTTNLFLCWSVTIFPYSYCHVHNFSNGICYIGHCHQYQLIFHQVVHDTFRKIKHPLNTLVSESINPFSLFFRDADMIVESKTARKLDVLRNLKCYKRNKICI